MKHSSVLPVARIALRTLIVLNFVYGALIFALLAISFLAEAWTWRALGVGHIAGHESIVAGMRAIMVIGIAAVPLVHLILRRLLAMVETVRDGDAFVPVNAERLKQIAWGVFGLEILHAVVAAIAEEDNGAGSVVAEPVAQLRRWRRLMGSAQPSSAITTSGFVMSRAAKKHR